ncbi:sulfite exporter TauE/SafE family protein [Dyella sp. 20L07]|uniref:sulfite exporter TauE/SafE family protein n=1 Tax=Dyella sp. 20L07 TaxID=3384240 RepID=UPI003D2987CB
MSLWLLLLFFATVAAFTISALSGGGAGLMLLPILRLALPAAQVPAALSIGSTVSSASRITLFFPHIHWPVVRWFVPTAVPCVWLGAWLLTYVEPAYLEAVLGLFLLSNLPMLLRPAKVAASGSTQPRWTLSLIGAAAGFVSGLTGAVGLIFNRFYLQYGLTKDQVIATRAANEIILHLIKLVLYGMFGLLTPDVLTAGATIAVAALGATWLSRRVLPYLSETLFKRIGYAAMVLSGVFMCGNAGAVLADRHQVAMHTTGSRQGFQSRLDWADARLTLEFKYKEGFEFEQVIDWEQLPADRQRIAAPLIEAADRVVVEEVRTFRQRSYELYVYRNGQLSKYKL